MPGPIFSRGFKYVWVKKHALWVSYHFCIIPQIRIICQMISCKFTFSFKWTRQQRIINPWMSWAVNVLTENVYMSIAFFFKTNLFFLKSYKLYIYINKPFRCVSIFVLCDILYIYMQHNRTYSTVVIII